MKDILMRHWNFRVAGGSIHQVFGRDDDPVTVL